MHDKMEDLVIKILQTVIDAAKDYELSIKESFEMLQTIDKDILYNMKENSPKVSELLNEFETIYNRINKEI